MIKQLPKSYEEKVNICVFEVDFEKKCKLSALLNRMQETTGKHCDKTVFSRDYLLSHGVFWALARVMIKIEKIPELNDEITIKTWAKSRDKMFAHRDFLLARDENPIARVTSDWILMDVNTRKTCKTAMLEEIGVIFPKEQEGALDERPGKIITQGEMVSEITKAVSYGDIDMYGHVNNVKYLEWAFDTFSAREMKGRSVKSLQVNFTAEAKDEEVIKIIRYKRQDAEFIIEGTNLSTGAKAFQVSLEMQDV